MDKCKNINNTIDALVNMEQEKKDVGRARIEERYAEGKGNRRSIFKKIVDRFNSEKYGKNISEKMMSTAFYKEYTGPNGQQAFLASLIEEMLADNDTRAYIFEDFVAKDMEQMNVWGIAKKDANGRPIFETLPYKYLTELYHKLWNFGMEKNWGNAKFKMGRISFGRPYNLPFQDSSGGYGIMEKAVSQYSDNVFREIREFLGWDGKRKDTKGKEYGANQIYSWTKEILNKMGEDTKQQMIDHHDGDEYAEQHFVKFLTWFNNGLIRWDESTSTFEIATDHTTDGQSFTQTARFKKGSYGGEKGKVIRTHKEKNAEDKMVAVSYDILLEDKTGEEPSRIVNNVPVSNVVTSTKDFIFQWDNFIPLVPWNKVDHGSGGQYEQRNNDKELDPRVADFLKNHFSMPPKAVERMREMRMLFKGTESVQGRPAFKGLHQEAFKWAQERMLSTKKEVDIAIKKWFTYEEGGVEYEYDEELVSQALRAVWDSKYQVGPDVPQDLIDIIADLKKFTEFTLFENLFWDTKYMEEKDAFPIQYVPNVMTQEFNRFKPRLQAEIDTLEVQKAQAKSGKLDIQDKIDDMKSAMAHADWALGRASMLAEDSLMGGKLLTHQDTVHAKHITNAFDPFNMRTDDQLYETYLTNMAKTFERNILSARHLDAIRTIRKNKKLNPDATEAATTSLFMGTINHPETRAMWAGVDISPSAVSAKLEKFNIHIPQEQLEIFFKSNNMWLTATLLGGYMTAVGNAGQAVEKMMIWGQEVNAWATNYYVKRKNDPGLAKLLEKAQVGAFTDYFSQNLIGEIESLEEARYKVIPAITAMWKYKKAVEKNDKKRKPDPDLEEREFEKMAAIYKEHMRQTIDKNAVPALDELITQRKAMNKKARLEIINKLANRAITGSWKGAKPTKKFTSFKKVFNRDFRYMIQLKRDLMGLPTLAGTEANTRSVSWIIAAEMHRRMMNYETQLYDLEPAIEDIQQALLTEIDPGKQEELERQLVDLRKQRMEYMYFGKNATRLMDFDLIKGLYSESSRASLGKFWGIFGDFGKQRMEEEGKKYNRKYRTEKRIRLTEEGEFPWHKDGKAGHPLPHHDENGDPINLDHFDIPAMFYTLGAAAKGMPQAMMLPESLYKVLKEDYVPKHVRQTTNKSDAQVQRLGSIVMYTWIYNTLLFGPFTAIAPKFMKAYPRKMLMKLTGSHKLGNANSDIATLVQAAFVALAWSSWHEDDEDIDPDDWFQAIMQSIPIFGVGGTVFANIFMGVIDVARKGVQHAWKAGEKVIKPWFPKTTHPLLEDATDKLEEM